MDRKAKAANEWRSAHGPGLAGKKKMKDDEDWTLIPIKLTKDHRDAFRGLFIILSFIFGIIALVGILQYYVQGCNSRKDLTAIECLAGKANKK